MGASQKRRLEDLGGLTQLPQKKEKITGDQDLPTRQSLADKRAAFGRTKHALATMASMNDDGDHDDDTPSGAHMVRILGFRVSGNI